MTVLQTAVPDVTITETGFSVPSPADILAGRITDMTNALGGGASQSLSSPQGQIAMSDAEIVAQVYDKLLCLFNQINPDYATGRMQDGLGRIYFQERISAQGTVVTATCIGKPGTRLPAGTSAQDENGYIYQTSSEVIIGSGGSVDVQFTNSTTGPITCRSGSLNQIYRPVSGWEALSNASPGVVGVNVEPRIAFETRRRLSVARNSRNMDGSVRASLLETSGVLDAYVWSNRKDEAVEIGVTNVSVPGHCYWICTYGGANEDIAESIFRTYNPGANMTGNVSVTVYDKENYSAPYPEYVMQWQEASPTKVYFRVELDKSLNPPSDISTLVKKRVVDVFNGEYEGIPKARIGSTIAAGRFFAPLIDISPTTMAILSLEISLDGKNYHPAVTMGVDQVPTIQNSDIEVILT